MKFKNLFILAITIIFGISTMGQEKKMSKFKTLKIGYITQTLELTAEEAEKFWPIYNLHYDNIHKIRHSVNRKLRGDLNNPEKLNAMSNDEAQVILNKLLKQDSEMQKEQALMFSKLKDVLPAKKLLKLHKAEGDFNRKILEQYRRRKEAADGKDKR